MNINSDESKAVIAREARLRPFSEKVCNQYIRGLLTQDELIDALVVIAMDDEAENNG
jgi:hypothetical protein